MHPRVAKLCSTALKAGGISLNTVRRRTERRNKWCRRGCPRGPRPDLRTRASPTSNPSAQTRAEQSTPAQGASPPGSRHAVAGVARLDPDCRLVGCGHSLGGRARGCSWSQTSGEPQLGRRHGRGLAAWWETPSSRTYGALRPCVMADYQPGRRVHVLPSIPPAGSSPSPQGTRSNSLGKGAMEAWCAHALNTTCTCSRRPRCAGQA